jgi:hypothetical protein
MAIKINLILNSLFPTIPFSQLEIISKASKYNRLRDIYSQHDGLCELVCNDIFNRDLLGRTRELKGYISPSSLSRREIIQSHIWNTFSLREKALMYLGIFPRDVTRLEMNYSDFERSFSAIPNHETLKVYVVTGFGCGHSLLIKKLSANRFIFFDPNRGEFRNQSLWNVYDHLLNILDEWHGNLVMIKGSDYLNRLSHKSSS